MHKYAAICQFMERTELVDNIMKTWKSLNHKISVCWRRKLINLSYQYGREKDTCIIWVDKQTRINSFGSFSLTTSGSSFPFRAVQQVHSWASDFKNNDCQSNTRSLKVIYYITSSSGLVFCSLPNSFCLIQIGTFVRLNSQNRKSRERLLVKQSNMTGWFGLRYPYLLHNIGDEVKKKRR